MNRPLGRLIRTFNPGTFQPDDEVTAQFVVRRRELEVVLEILRDNIESPSCQHLLVVAPRGRGKTMLLARVAAELRTNPEFSDHLFPVRFMEESQEVFNMADFWLETLFHLANEADKSDTHFARQLRKTRADLAARWRDTALEDHGRDTVLQAADHTGRKIVLMVENLQDLCASVDDDFGWKLRQALQSEPQIMLLGTATSRFAALDDAKEAFFELFRVVGLAPLDTRECRQLWQTVSGDQSSQREIRPLEILTGGSPRLLVIIAQFALHRSLRQLMEELVVLIDDHTEYFRTHLDALSKTERRVYLAVVDLWQPSTTGEVAARARMDVRGVSVQLGRLVSRGAVTVQGSRGKRLYAAAERLYSIYYKLRRERDEAAIVHNLLHFMAGFYSPPELGSLSTEFLREAAGSPFIREGIERALAEEPQLRNAFSGKMWWPESKIEDPVDTFEPAPSLPRDSESTVEPEVGDSVSASGQLILEALRRCEVDDLPGAIAIYDKIVERYARSDIPEVQTRLAARMFGRAIARGRQDDPEGAITDFDALLERFGASNVPDVQTQVATALLYKAVTRGRQGDPGAEIADYDALLERFGASNVPDVQTQVATALLYKAVTRGRQGDPGAEIADYDALLERFGASNVPDVQAQVAKALLYKAVAERQLGDEAGKIATCDQLLERFGASDVPDVQSQVATALLYKAITPDQLGDEAGKIATYDELLDRFGASSQPEVQPRVAAALVGRAGSRRRQGDLEAEIADYDEAVARFGTSSLPEVQPWVAAALVGRAVSRGRQGDLEAEIAGFDEAVARFGASDVPDVQAWVATALLYKAVTQGQLADEAGKIATYDELLDRFGASKLPEVQTHVATALVDKAVRQVESSCHDDALKSCVTVEAMVESLPEGEQVRRVAWTTKWVRANVMVAQGDRQAAVDAYRSMYSMLVPSDPLAIRRITQLTGRLIAVGASALDLVALLTSDTTKAGVFEPVVVALRQYAGEEIRTPAEVHDVAADILEGFKAEAARIADG